MELDEFLCLSFPLLSKGYLRRQIREGRVLVDGSPALPSRRLRNEEVLSVELEEEEGQPAAPVAPPVEIGVLYEDDDVLVVEKPSNLAVEPERWRRDAACLAGALLEMARERSGKAGSAGKNAPDSPGPGPSGPGTPLDLRLRLVHRIDKDTTGAVLVAKNLEAERRLRAAFEGGEIEKEYLALVEGEYPLADGESDLIDLPIGPDERKSGRMRVQDPGGKPSRTRVAVEQRFYGYTLLRCSPLTGRTHQIRVHLQEVGFPLVVDPLYGRRKALLLSEIKRGYRHKRGHREAPLIDRLTLHAEVLTFPRPGEPAASDSETSGVGRVRVEAPVPADMQRALKQLSKVRPPRR